MGIRKVLKFFGRALLDVTVATAIIIFLPGLPPYVDFPSFTLTPAMPLEGKLARNTLLDRAVPILDGKVMGPESIAVRKNEIYTGLIGGQVIRFKDGRVEPVAKFGQDCEGKWEEAKCGRPLGMRFDATGKLIVADAYYGIFRVDVDSGKVDKLVCSNDTIDGKQPMIPNDLDVAKDGTIFWSDSSTNAYLNDALVEFLAEPSGRLLKYNPKTKTSEVLLDKLHFANGVQLSEKEDFVIVAESARSRVMKYYLSGNKKGTSEVFIDGLPGSPDNIRSSKRGSFYISLVVPRDSTKYGLLDIMGPLPYARKLVLRVLCFIKLIISGVQNVASIEYVDKAQYWLGHLEPTSAIFPKHSIVVEVDEKGNIVRSLQATKGEVAHISEFTVDDDRKYAYLASPYNTKIWKVNVAFLYPEYNIPEITLG